MGNSRTAGGRVGQVGATRAGGAVARTGGRSARAGGGRLSSGLYRGGSRGGGIGYDGDGGRGYGSRGGRGHHGGHHGHHGHHGHYDHHHHHHYGRRYWGFGGLGFWFGYGALYPWAPSPYQIYHGYRFGYGFGGLGYGFGGLGLGYGFYGNYGFFGNGWRFGCGFGHGYNPGFYGYLDYPCYVAYDYYPYSYYSTVGFYPGYAPAYHAYYRSVDYLETADPYVEIVDDVPVSVGRPRRVLPEVFDKPFVTEFPEGLSTLELVAKGDEWLRSGTYLMAAEAYRRAWTGRVSDDYAPVQMGIALAGAGRLGLASFALGEGLSRNPKWIERPVDLAKRFARPDIARDLVTEVERHVVKNPRDGDARFLLGYLYLGSGNAFGAHTEFSVLEEGEYVSEHLAPLKAEARKRSLAGKSGS